MTTLTEYVNRHFPIPFQTQLVRNAVRYTRDGTALNRVQERTDHDCELIVEEALLKPATGNHRDVRFIGFDQARVNALGECFDIAHAMLTEARRHVGLHTWGGKTAYESAFGAQAWHHRSATRKAGLVRGDVHARSGFLSRAGYVRTKIDEMLADLRDPRWIVYDSEDRKDAASLKGGRGGYVIGLGSRFPRGAVGHFHAGVLIHEVGHNLGLADVCDQCFNLRPLLAAAHFMPYPDADIPQCGDNAAHGKMTALGKGHFNGSKQVTRLAENHKNATIYNTDSYRWYCYAFFRSLVEAGVAEDKRLRRPA